MTGAVIIQAKVLKFPFRDHLKPFDLQLPYSRRSQSADQVFFIDQVITIEDLSLIVDGQQKSVGSIPSSSAMLFPVPMAVAFFFMLFSSFALIIVNWPRAVNANDTLMKFIFSLTRPGCKC